MNPSLPMPNNQSTAENIFLNPIIRRMMKCNEDDGTTATYGGVAKKTVFFLLMVLVGAAAAFTAHAIPFAGITDDDGTFFSYIEIGLLIASLAMVLVCPFLAALLKKTTPVTGALSCFGNGCILAAVGIFLPDFRGAMLLAFLLTFAIVGVMLFLYFSGRINVTKKFRVVVYTLFGTMILGSALLGICYFIPACHEIFTFLQDDVLVSALFSVVGIVIATLFLLVDFDTVRQIVDNKLSQKYEWMAAYSIAFTVIWLYFKVLDLVMAAQKSRNRTF